jgi:zinc transporter ZupT
MPQTLTQALNSYSMPTSVVSSQAGMAGGAWDMSSVSSAGSQAWGRAKAFASSHKNGLAWAVMGMVLAILVLLIVDKAVFEPKRNSSDAKTKEEGTNAGSVVNGVCMGVSVTTLGFSLATALVK